MRNWIHAAHRNDNDELDDSCKFPIDYLKIKGAYSAGLAAKRGSVYAKDSIDFLVIVDDPDNLYYEPWGFECKGRTTSDTAADEEDFHSSLLGSKHTRIDSKHVFEDIRIESERFQILHHAFVYDLKTVVLAIGDGQGELISTTIVDFDEDLKRHYGNMIDELFGLSLSWLYDDKSFAMNDNQ